MNLISGTAVKNYNDKALSSRLSISLSFASVMAFNSMQISGLLD